MPNWTTQTFGCSLPKGLLKELDIMRGDVNRSRYIQRLIENKMNAVSQIDVKVGAPNQSVKPASKGNLVVPHG
jgi:hypothetical protein